MNKINNKIKHNIKNLSAISFLLLAIVLAPTASFAKENGQNKNGIKVEQHANLKADKKVGKEDNKQNNSIWSRIFGNWFTGRARAANTTKNQRTNERPNISGITAPTVLKTGEVGKWTVKASDPQNTALSYAVDWGESSSTSLQKSMTTDAFVQTSTFYHTYDTTGTYTVKFTVTNEAGLTTSSSTSVRVTGKRVNDTNTPVITSLKGPDSIEEGDEATVTIKAYDPKNLDLTYSADWGDTMIKALSVTSSSRFVQTTNLSHVYDEPGTYTATFTARNSAGYETSSSIKIKVTDSDNDDDDTAPKIIGNVGLTIGSKTATITWTTDEAADSEVYYSTSTPVDVDANNTDHVSNGSRVKSHSINLSGLGAGTHYHFKIKSSDASGNSVTSSVFTFTTSS